jgi:peptide methionine sulfoxide reductase msrA/msrB
MDGTYLIKVITACMLFMPVCTNVYSKEDEMVDKKSAGTLEKATFAGGCFWCMEPPFQKLEGVLSVTPGYTGGNKKNPTYEQVCSGTTGHLEAIEIVFDPEKISYTDLLDVFWRQIDPTDSGGQFADRGHQYKTAIFYHDDRQKKLAEESRAALNSSGRFPRPVVTEIIPASEFYPAEKYHQDYYKKNPLRYKLYRQGSSRDSYLEKVWSSQKAEKGSVRPRAYKKLSEEEICRKLTPLQFQVTQDNGTEPPFDNQYWNNKKEGIYVDVVSGEPLFCSVHKFESGTGWPSFFRPLEPDNIAKKEDRRMSMLRTEVRSRHAGSHLGHVFNDGPSPTGLRYCINSAALRFIPKDDLEKEGYGEYKKMFEAGEVESKH